MSFHLNNCNRLPITRSKKTSPQQVDYTLHGQILETVPPAKYLGVTLQCDLGWGTRINNVCAKANRMLSFLGRNPKICSVKIKERVYKALTRPITEYAACAVWDPHNDKHISNLKKVQRRAARFVLNRHRNTSSVGDMLHQLKWSTLQHRRRTIRLTMLYKITTGQACVRCPDLKLQPAGGRRSHHSLQYQRFSCRTDYRSNTISPAQSETGTNSPQMCTVLPPPLTPSSRRCHPRPNKFQHFSFFLLFPACITINAGHPEMTVMDSFVADGH